MNKKNKSVARRLALSVLLLSCTSLAWASPSNKWRIEVSGGADSDGTITLAVAPIGQDVITVEIPVPDGKGENAVDPRGQRRIAGLLDAEVLLALWLGKLVKYTLYAWLASAFPSPWIRRVQDRTATLHAALSRAQALDPGSQHRAAPGTSPPGPTDRPQP